jgi:transposase
MEKYNMSRRTRCYFTEEFKKQMVELYHSGKKRADIIREYDLTPSTFDKWVRNFNQSGSVNDKDNRSPEAKELEKLQKEIARLRMENDILKQAAVIMGRKEK